MLIKNGKPKLNTQTTINKINIDVLVIDIYLFNFSLIHSKNRISSKKKKTIMSYYFNFFFNRELYTFSKCFFINKETLYSFKSACCKRYINT